MVPTDQRFSQAILDTLPTHVAVVEADGTIVAVNKAWKVFADANGDPGQARTGVGTNYLDVARRACGSHSEEGPTAYSGITAVLDGSLPEFALEYPCHSPSQQRWFLMTVTALTDTPLKAVVSHLDITPRKLLENRLRASEDRFRELAQHLHQALWVIDAAEAKVLYVSPAYERVWGRSCQNLLDDPRSYLDGIHPQDQERVRSANAAMYQTGRIDVECRVQRPDGTVAWVWIRGYPVTEQGRIVRLVGVTEDITERKKAEEETGRLAAIIEFADDAIVSLTLTGIVISWNQGAERLYGYSAEEMIGHPIAILHPPDKHDEYLSVMARTRRGERIAAFETVRRRKDGTLIDVSLSASAIEVVPGHVTGTSKISHDITRIKLLEEQFRQAQKMEAIGTLAGGVAHDFNNLLTVINGYSDMLIGQLPTDDPVRKLLVEIHKAGERAGNLPVQTVGEESIGQFEEEVPSHGLLHAMETHAGIEEAVDDGVADAVGVLGSWFDPFDSRAEGLAAGAGGTVFSNRQFDEDDLSVGNVSNTSCAGAHTGDPFAARVRGTRNGVLKERARGGGSAAPDVGAPAETSPYARRDSTCCPCHSFHVQFSGTGGFGEDKRRTRSGNQQRRHPVQAGIHGAWAAGSADLLGR